VPPSTYRTEAEDVAGLLTRVVSLRRLVHGFAPRVRRDGPPPPTAELAAALAELAAAFAAVARRFPHVRGVADASSALADLGGGADVADVADHLERRAADFDRELAGRSTLKGLRRLVLEWTPVVDDSWMRAREVIDAIESSRLEGLVVCVDAITAGESESKTTRELLALLARSFCVGEADLRRVLATSRVRDLAGGSVKRAALAAELLGDVSARTVERRRARARKAR
jgi:hypothetical protein